jgi:hypothetical protein
MVKHIHTLALRTLVVPRSKLPPPIQSIGLSLYNQKIKEMEETINSLKQTINAIHKHHESLLDDGR